MKNKKSIFCILSLALIVFGLSASRIFAQPSAAQIKKLFTLPNAVSVVVHKPGKRVWSEGYKKYVWDIAYTVKLKTETPGVLRIVRGISSFDIIGGRYVYWRDFVSDNSYEGIANPTAADLRALIERFGEKEFIGRRSDVIGKIESIKLAGEPKYEWHTINSVSFNVVAVYTRKGNGNTAPDERGEQTTRVRLYRDDPKAEWNEVYGRQGAWKTF